MSAVVPDGLGVLDDDLEHVWSQTVGSGHEAGEEGGVAFGHAGLGEASLGDRVVLRQEEELDNVAEVGHDVVGVKVEAVQAGRD